MNYALSPSTSLHSCEDHLEHSYCGTVCPLNPIIEDQLKV